MRTVFLGYSEVGVAGLETLLEVGAEVVAVFTHEDDPGENRWFGSVPALARARGIPTFTPEDVNRPEWVAKLRDLAPEILLSFYFRRIVSEEVLAIPPRGCFNLHGSLLPKYRGRVPTHWAIIHGETETGVTLHEMVKRADAGAIVAQKRVPIGLEETSRDVLEKQAAATRDLVREIWPDLVAGTAPRIPQDAARATRFPGRRPKDGLIDWTRTSRQVFDLVRAVTDPYPGAFTLDGPERILVWWGRPHDDREPGAPPGAVLGHSGEGVEVACGAGVFEVLRAQKPPAEPVEGEALHRLLAGVRAFAAGDGTSPE